MPLRIRVDQLTSLKINMSMLSRHMRTKVYGYLREIGDMVVEGSQARAPVLTGAVEMGHKLIVRGRGADGATVDIVVTGGGTDKYVNWLHESNYDLGKLSEAKQADNPGIKVGPKFLERALRYVSQKKIEKILDNIIEEL